MYSTCSCSLCRVGLVLQFPARGSTQVLLCFFPGVLNCGCDTSYIYSAFMAGAASQAGDADSSRAPGLTSGLQGSVNVHRGFPLLVPQWQCISSFVFYTSLVCSLNIAANFTPKSLSDRIEIFINFLSTLLYRNFEKLPGPLTCMLGPYNFRFWSPGGPWILQPILLPGKYC